MSTVRPISSAVSLVVALLCGAAWAQSDAQGFAFANSGVSIVALSTVPQLSPDLALTAYERAREQQDSSLAGYTSISLIHAELPDSSQQAEIELVRRYAAPSQLEFTPVRSSGDKFVKTNVIARLLQSETDHVRRHEQRQTAITSANYKVSYKGMVEIRGVGAYQYDLKPRSKRVGLFKGKIFLNPNGELLRAEGTIAKSPSFFIKKVSFTQDYVTVNGFTFPSHLHSEAETRIVGKAIVDIDQKNFQAMPSDAPGTTEVAMGTN